jgi:uncharacterized protein DUF4124
MHAVNRTEICLLGWLLLLHSSVVFGGDLFQWTDAKGIPHFTDDLYTVPEMLRQSSNFRVRKDFFSPPGASEGKQRLPEPLPPHKPEPTRDVEINPEQPTETTVSDSPEEVIVVVNSTVRKPTKKFCDGSISCRPGVRADSNRPRYPHRGASKIRSR